MEEEKSKVSKAQQKAVAKYVKTKYDRFGLTMPKGNLEKIKAHAGEQGESVNGFIGRAIDEAIARDSKQPLEAVLRREKVSGIELPSETEKIAKMATERTGEGIDAFITRAVKTQFQRDGVLYHMGTNPLTGEKLAKASEEKPADTDKDKPADEQAEE